MWWTDARRPRLAVTLLALALLACATPGATPDGAPAACVPDFPYQDGWLGGDGAYSVALGHGRSDGERPTLWLFGDSFVAGAARTDRSDASFVHNSVGLSRCGAGGFEIDYYWGRDAVGAPAAFIEPAEGDGYYWLFDGFVHQGALYLGLLELEEAPPAPPLQLPFRMTGMSLARIDDPDAPPETWRPRIATLSRSRRAFPAAAMAVEGDHVHLFAFTALTEHGEGGQQRFLTRLPLAALEPFPEDLSPQLETLVARDEWAPGLLPDRALVLMPDNASEMSVERHPRAGRWIAVYGAPIQTAPGGGPPPVALSDEVYLRHAGALGGPWSGRILLFRIPELSGEPPSARDPNLVCYGAKAHAEFAPEDALLVTYVCNLHTRPGEDPYAILRRLQDDMTIYRPRAVLAPLPEALLAECARPLPDLWEGISDCLPVP